MKLLLEKNSMSQTHLVHISIDMNHFHGSLAGSNLVELPILMFPKQPRLGIPDRFVVNIILAWFAMAVGSLCGLNDGQNL